MFSDLCCVSRFAVVVFGFDVLFIYYLFDVLLVLMLCFWFYVLFWFF